MKAKGEAESQKAAEIMSFPGGEYQVQILKRFLSLVRDEAAIKT